MRKRIFGIALICFSFLAHGFELTTDFKQGYYWDSFPIELSVVDDGSLTSSELDRLVQSLNHGIEKWHAELNLNVELWRFTGITNSKIGNSVYWESNFAAVTGLSGSQVLGATVRTTRTPLMRQVDLVLNRTYLYLGDEELNQVIIHELGHSIGLDHSSDYNSIMYAQINVSFPSQEILQDDYSGINYIVDEMIKRQQGISTDRNFQVLTEESKSQNASSLVPSCGTIKDINSGGGDGDGGSFLISLLLGCFLVLIGKKFPLKMSI